MPGWDDEDGLDVAAQPIFTSADAGKVRRQHLMLSNTTADNVHLYGWIDFDLALGFFFLVLMLVAALAARTILLLSTWTTMGQGW